MKHNAYLLSGAVMAAFIGLGGAQFAIADSTVIGNVQSDVRVNRAQQNQSGLLNKQEANVGSVSDSTVIGNVNTKTNVNSLQQNQSGLLNKQKMSIGTVD